MLKFELATPKLCDLLLHRLAGLDGDRDFRGVDRGGWCWRRCVGLCCARVSRSRTGPDRRHPLRSRRSAKAGETCAEHGPAEISLLRRLHTPYDHSICGVVAATAWVGDGASGLACRYDPTRDCGARIVPLAVPGDHGLAIPRAVETDVTSRVGHHVNYCRLVAPPTSSPLGGATGLQ